MSFFKKDGHVYSISLSLPLDFSFSPAFSQSLSTVQWLTFSSLLLWRSLSRDLLSPLNLSHPLLCSCFLSFPLSLSLSRAQSSARSSAHSSLFSSLYLSFSVSSSMSSALSIFLSISLSVSPTLSYSPLCSPFVALSLVPLPSPEG